MTYLERYQVWCKTAPLCEGDLRTLKELAGDENEIKMLLRRRAAVRHGRYPRYYGPRHEPHESLYGAPYRTGSRRVAVRFGAAAEMRHRL